MRMPLAAVLAAVIGHAPMASAGTEALVSADWLEKNLADPNLRRVEVRVEPGVYERGHIPDAANIV